MAAAFALTSGPLDEKAKELERHDDEDAAKQQIDRLQILRPTLYGANRCPVEGILDKRPANAAPETTTTAPLCVASISPVRRSGSGGCVGGVMDAYYRRPEENGQRRRCRGPYASDGTAAGHGHGCCSWQRAPAPFDRHLAAAFSPEMTTCGGGDATPNEFQRGTTTRTKEH